MSIGSWIKKKIAAVDPEKKCPAPGQGAASAPVNYRARDVSGETLRNDAEYAYKIGSSYVASIRSHGAAIKGLRVIEFGPGHNFGTALYLVCHGMRVAVADRFLPIWTRDYYPLFYKELMRCIEEKEPGLTTEPIKKVLDSDGYPKEVLTLYESSMEEMSPLTDVRCDVTLSNAVLEHLYDVDKAFAHLSRLTVEGGLGFHQVDHRDHRDFNRPLEYLTLSEEEFRTMFIERHGECGNRMRPDEMEKKFRVYGFDVLHRRENIDADPDYLEEFYPRLSRAKRSVFSSSPKESLRCVSCQYVIRKRREREACM